MTVPQEAIDAACDALAETGSAVAALEAAAPHIAAAAYGQGRDDEAAGEPIPDWIRNITERTTT